MPLAFRAKQRSSGFPIAAEHPIHFSIILSSIILSKKSKPSRSDVQVLTIRTTNFTAVSRWPCLFCKRSSVALRRVNGAEQRDRTGCRQGNRAAVGVKSPGQGDCHDFLPWFFACYFPPAFGSPINRSPGQMLFFVNQPCGISSA